MAFVDYTSRRAQRWDTSLVAEPGDTEQNSDQGLLRSKMRRKTPRLTLNIPITQRNSSFDVSDHVGAELSPPDADEDALFPNTPSL